MKRALYIINQDRFCITLLDSEVDELDYFLVKAIFLMIAMMLLYMGVF